MWGSPTPLPALLIAAQARFNSRQRDGCRESRACINLPDSSICRGSGAEQEWDFISVIPVFCAPRPPYYPPPLLIHALQCRACMSVCGLVLLLPTGPWHFCIISDCLHQPHSTYWWAGSTFLSTSISQASSTCYICAHNIFNLALFA